MVIKVLEFYSGIGGMHFALKESGLDYEVSGAFDIHDGANTVYRHNFPSTSLLQRNISGVTAEEFDKLGADLWTISPPCQPFTRLGKRKDMADSRTDSFQTLLEQIKRMKNPPSYILLENVKGFEESEARSLLAETLRELNMFFRECLLSPNQFNIPNSRLRYYMIARKTKNFDWGSPGTLTLNLPDIAGSTDSFSDDLSETKSTLREFLEPVVSKDDSSWLPDKVLLKYANILDIVTDSSSNSCCFTKAYGHYVEGTGSVIQMNIACDRKTQYALAMDEACTDTEKLDYLRPLGLRYFLPLEIARLMKFPNEFEFPCSFSRKQRYKLLGNSVNVHVVAQLLALLFYRCSDDSNLLFLSL